MTQRDVITEAILQAALAALDERIAKPPPLAERRYSRREAFVKLRAKTNEALAAGHSLETVLDDLKGIGLGMTIATARQYLKPGKRSNKTRSGTQVETASKSQTKSAPVIAATKDTAKKGTFPVIDDDNEI